ncbi:MAG: malonic semialdehyde reductase [Actinomycetota bacterium]|nr:malonic semialdehyde reductase [Actinomycetota bacterium]
MTSVTETSVLADDARALLFTGARSAGSFTDEAVTEEQLREIHELYKFGPTSMNTQPMRVVYVGPDDRDRLVAHLGEGNKAKTAAAPAVAILAADTAFHEHFPTFFPDRAHLREQFEPMVEARTDMARLNATLQAAYYIMAVRAVGLDAGPMTGLDAAGIDGEFFPDGRLQTLMVVNIGHATPPEFDRLPRLGFEKTTTVL